MKRNISILVIICLIIIGNCSQPAVVPTPTSDYGGTFIAPSSTSTLTTFDAIVLNPNFCYNGPSDLYPKSVDDMVAPNMNVTILGKIKDDSNWFMVQAPSIGRCWMQQSNLDISRVDQSRLVTFIAATTTVGSNCYSDLSDSPVILTFVPEGLKIVLYARNSAGSWVLVSPRDTTQQCWILSSELTSFDLASLSIDPFSSKYANSPALSFTPTTLLLAMDPTATKKPKDHNSLKTSIPSANPPPTDPPTSPPPTSPPPTNPPPTNPPKPTATLCWPPGHCK